MVGRSRFVQLPEISMRNGSLLWPGQAVEIDTLVVSNPELELWRDQQGVFSTELLLAPSSAHVPEAEAG